MKTTLSAEINPFDATIVITTRGRCDDLRRALRSCVCQSGVRLEILVFDDASTDGTADMVTTEFSSVRLIRCDVRQGYIVLRNCGFQEARSPILFSIDDDAWFSEPGTVSEVLRQFGGEVKTAAFALRYTEPHRTARQGFMRPLESGSQVRSYIGCAHAIRRDVALSLKGYPEYLIHQGEERDLCLRLLEAGYVVRYLDTPPIIHEPSAKRDHSQLAYLGLRNTFLFDMVNVPFPDVLWRLPADVLLLLKHRVSLNTFPLRFWDTVRALFACLLYLRLRRPVRRETYRKFRQLPSHGPVYFSTAACNLSRCPGSSLREDPA